MTRAWVILTVAALAGWAGAAIPGAEDPKATTRHDELRARLDYQRRTLAGAYREVGHRDARWDEPALALLEALAMDFAYYDAEPVYEPVGRPTRDDMFKLEAAVFRLKCEDPLVAYCLLRRMIEIRPEPGAVPGLEEVTTELIQRKYPPIRIMAAAEKMLELLKKTNSNDAERRRKYDKIAWDHTLAHLAGTGDDIDLREVMHQGLSYFLDLPPAKQGEFCNAMAGNKHVNPWLVAMYRGIWERKMAWAFRGGDWGNKVTEEGWKGFYAHLGNARDEFVKAHNLHPEFPEAAAEMIAVAMGGGDELKERPREWFDKAARAQFDYPHAYDNYVWAIYPRWGGSLREMMKFADECLATNRYDTAVPGQFRRILHDVDEDSTNDFTVFRIPAHKAALDVMFTRQAEKAARPELKDLCQSQHMAYAWRLGDFETAGKLLDGLGARASEEPLKKLGAWPPAALSEIRAMNSAEGKALAAAAQAAERGDLDRAIEQYGRAGAKLGKDHLGQFFVRFRTKSLELRRDFDKGGWVSLKPEEDFLPWSSAVGTWRRDAEGRMVGQGDYYGIAFLVCRHVVEGDYEIRATVETPDGAKPGPMSVFVEWDGEGRWCQFGIDGSKKVVFGGGYYSRVENPIEEFRGSHVVTARVRDAGMSIDVDGKTVIPNARLDRIPDRSKAFIALGMYEAPPGQRVARFKDVEVRRLRP